MTSFYEYVRHVADEPVERIGARIGVAASTVRRWETREPTPKDVRRIRRGVPATRPRGDDRSRNHHARGPS